MSISKRFYGVEGFKSSKSTLSLQQIKKAALNFVFLQNNKKAKLIDSFKKSTKFYFAYEMPNGKLETVDFIINEIESIEEIHDRINYVIQSANTLS